MGTPEGLIRCEICGEHKGTVQSSKPMCGPGSFAEVVRGKKAAPGHFIEVTCVCNGQPCAKCGRSRVHRPGSKSYVEEEDHVYLWPEHADELPCWECRQKRSYLDGKPSEVNTSASAEKPSGLGQEIRDFREWRELEQQRSKKRMLDQVEYEAYESMRYWPKPECSFDELREMLTYDEHLDMWEATFGEITLSVRQNRPHHWWRAWLLTPDAELFCDGVNIKHALVRMEAIANSCPEEFTLTFKGLGRLCIDKGHPAPEGTLRLALEYFAYDDSRMVYLVGYTVDGRKVPLLRFWERGYIERYEIPEDVARGCGIVLNDDGRILTEAERKCRTQT